MYDNIIPLILKNTFHLGETLTGAIMAADNVLALFLLPLFGTLSDVSIRHRQADAFYPGPAPALPFIFLLLLPVADRLGNLWLFITALFFVLLSMGLYRSPAVALMPDLNTQTAAQQRKRRHQLDGRRGRCLRPYHDQPAGGQRHDAGLFPAVSLCRPSDALKHRGSFLHRPGEQTPRQDGLRRRKYR